MHVFTTRRTGRAGAIAAAALATACLGATLLTAVAPAGAAAGDPVVVDYSNGFADANNLNLVGSAQLRAEDTSNVVQLTSATNGQAGAVWLPPSIDPTRDFSTDFTLDLHDTSGCPADGIDFVLQDSPGGNTALGDVGGAMGYSGIDPSFAAEFDIYGGNYGDPNANHVGFLKGGDPTNSDNPPSWTSTDVPTLYGNGPIHAWLDYTAATNSVRLYVGTSSVKPDSPTLNITTDLGALIGGRSVYAGFTAGTGACNAVQDVRTWNVSATEGVITNSRLTLTSDPQSPSGENRPTFSAAVRRKDGSTVAPSGHVDFFVDGVAAGSAPIGPDGVATYRPAAPLKNGAHQIRADYQGDGVADPATRTLTYQVSKIATSVRIVPSSGSTIHYGANVNAVVTQYSGAQKATGSMDWYSYDDNSGDSTYLTTTKVVRSKTVLPPTTLGLGSYDLYAVYSGDAAYPGNYAQAYLTVVQATSSTSLTSTMNPAKVRSNNYLIATVKPEFLDTRVTGTVTFTEGSTRLGVITLSPQGIAKLPLRTLSVGTHAITATYSGDTNFVGSQSNVYNQGITSS